jgi:hypothetical protein
VSVKYFDTDFKNYKDEWWPSIPIPAFYSILELQEFDVQTIFWLYTFFGMALYWCKEKNCWKIGVLILEYADTRKLSLLKTLQKIYSDENIGVLSNNCER